MGYMEKASKEHKTDQYFLTGVGAGANIRTPMGLRRIEMVHPGDLIVTRDNGLQPVRMVWKRRVTQSEILKNPSLAPVRLKPRAIGPMMPSRDLRISQGHRALIPGYRIAGVPDTQSYLMRIDAVAAYNDQTFIDRNAEEIIYYNLVFDSHQVFCVEGLPVESFRPSPKTIVQMDVQARAEIAEMFPSLAKRRCAYPSVPHPVAQSKAYISEELKP